MKFQKLDVLERHFKDSFPDHLCPVYLISSSSDGERKKILKSLSRRLEASCDLLKAPSVVGALDHLNAGSLFSKKMAAVFDGVELLTAKELELLNQYVLSPNPQAYLILGLSNGKQVADLYKVGKKEIVFLDLSQEKPWEEKDRLQKWVTQYLFAKKVSIRPDAVFALIDRFPPDRHLLQSELDKLYCYIGERGEITLQDVDAICLGIREINFFQLARDLVWGSMKELPRISDVSLLIPLVGQLRAQLEMGLKISTMLKKGSTQTEIGEAFPRLFPKVLQASIETTRSKGDLYFKKGLQALYDFELGLKTSRAKPEVLFNIFSAST